MVYRVDTSSVSPLAMPHTARLPWNEPAKPNLF